MNSMRSDPLVSSDRKEAMTQDSNPPVRWTSYMRYLPAFILIVGSAYALFPILWLAVASTKTPGQLFTTPTLLPSLTGGFQQNIRYLFSLDGGVFRQWAASSLLYAVGGGVVSALVSTMAGYGLAKYRFRGRGITTGSLLAGIFVPGVMLAIPQFLLFSRVGLTNTYWSVLIPSTLSPLGVFLAMIYAQASIPDDILEAGRIDGANEFRIFFQIGLPAMMPGIITVFLLQFVHIWNNFLLPYIMLADSSKFPITVGLYSLLNRGGTEPALYNLAITGALVSIIPLGMIVFVLQRYWKADLLSGSLKG